ncbi:MAG: YDG domain-containing protein [Bacteroidetes bacterium]|nr:YDG domain-containing protein [Bacteroidota bacterium]
MKIDLYSERQNHAARLRKSLKIIVVFIIVATAMGQVAWGARYSVASGNWNATSTWSASSGGAAGVSVPVAGDVVYIENGYTITVTADAACTTLNFAETSPSVSSGNLIVNNGFSLAVSGGISLNPRTTLSVDCSISGAGALTCASITVGGSTNSTVNTNATLTSTINTMNVSGNLNLVATYYTPSSTYYVVPRFYLNEGTLTVNGAITPNTPSTANSLAFRMDQGTHTGTLNLGGTSPWATDTDLSAPWGSGGITYTLILNAVGTTVNYNLAGNQTINRAAASGTIAISYYNLTLSGSGNKSLPASSTATVSGTLSMQGTAAMTTTAATFGANSTLEYKGSGAQLTTNLEFPTTSGPKNLIIDNTNGVTLHAARTISGTTTVNSGCTFATNATFTNNGTTTINGSFQINTGGYASGTNFVYGASGSLSFNNSTSYGVDNTHVYWPTTSGPANVTILQGGLTLGSGVRTDRTVTGTFQTAAAVTLSNSSVITINGTCQINAGGSFNQAPTYGNTSSLKYNLGGIFDRSAEWSTISGAGFPNDVQISNSTTLNYPNSGGSAFALPLIIARDLTIDAGSSLYMDYGGGANKSGSLTVNRNISIAGNVSLGDAINGDLNVGGNWTHTTGTFNTNSRTVFFNGATGDQTITKSGGETFSYFTINKATSGDVILANDVTINNTLTLTKGLVTTGSNTITIASAGTLSGAGVTSFVNGKLARVITSTTATAFPVGKGGNYRPVTFTYTAAPTSKTVTIEQFESGSPLSLASISTARFGARYWNITQSATGIDYTVGLNNSGLTPTGSVVILRREGTGTVTSNATSFSTPTYTNSSSFSTGNGSNDVQLGETSIPLTVSSPAATSKMYDKTNTAAITGTLSGVVSPDAVTLNGTGTFASVNVANGIGVTSTSTLAGANAGAYSLTQPTGLTANIIIRPLTITGAANTKTFDGNNSSTATPTVTSGVVQSGDVAAFTQGYDNANVGTSKVMTPSGIVTDGNSGNNYSYSFVPSSNGIINAATSAQWNGSLSANWNTPGNWTPPVAPTTGISGVIVSAGTAPIISSTGNLCNDLTITSGSLTIAGNGNLTVGGNVSNTPGTSGLVISSGGSLIQNSAVPAMVERDISAWGAGTTHGWHFLSSPVAEQAIATAFTNATAANYDFFAWYEPSNLWVNYKNTSVAPTWNTANSNLTSFIPGTGYLVGYAATETKQFAGTLNKDDITISNLAISAGTNQGWHLLGNPFTSAITWGTTDWLLTNINATAKIWEESSASYIDVSANGKIPALNGFMVQVTSGTGSLTIPKTDRVHDGTAWYKSGDMPSIVLAAIDNDGKTAQQSNVRFDNRSTAGFDPDFDSHFLPGYAPLFYSVAGTENLSTNTLPDAGGTVRIPFDFIRNDGGNFSIEAKAISNINGPVILNDLITNYTQDLSVNPVYSFTSVSGDTPHRFMVTFSHVGIGEIRKNNVFNVYSSGNSLYVINNTGNNQGNIYVYNMMGQIIATSALNGSSNCTLNLNLPTGYYLVKVVTSDQAYSSKVFMN